MNDQDFLYDNELEVEPDKDGGEFAEILDRDCELQRMRLREVRDLAAKYLGVPASKLSCAEQAANVYEVLLHEFGKDLTKRYFDMLWSAQR